MTNWTELKRLAEEAVIARPGSWYTQDDCCWWTGNADEGDFIAAANPKTILALIAENDGLRKRARIAEREATSSIRMLKGLEKVARVVDANSDDVCGENNQLRAEVEALRSIALELRGLVACEDVNHRHGEFHEADEPCKVLARIDSAISKSNT